MSRGGITSHSPVAHNAIGSGAGVTGMTPAGAILADAALAGGITEGHVPAGSIQGDGELAGGATEGHVPAGAIQADAALAGDSPAEMTPVGGITADGELAGGATEGHVPAGAIQADGELAGDSPTGHVPAGAITADGELAGGGVTGMTPAGVLTMPVYDSLAAWFRADMGVTLNGANVSTWADQSGNGRDLTQAVAGDQPLFEAAGLGGQASILGDGASEFLKAAGFALNRPWTVFAIIQLVAHGAGNMTLVDGNATNSSRLYDAAGTNWNTFSGQSGGNLIASSLTPHILCAQYTDAAQTLRQDNAAPVVGAAATAQAGGLTVLANGDGLGGWANARIAELIVYSVSLSDPQITALSQYASNRYGIAI